MRISVLRRRGPACAEGRHTLESARLLLRTPTVFEAQVASAAGSDAEAQRWLGWEARHVAPDVVRRRLAGTRARRGRPSGAVHPALSMCLVAIDLRQRAYVGMASVTSVDARTCEVGGYLGPEYRGHGLGAELFAGVLRLAHEHLGYAEVRAGTETGNLACAVSLERAGFAAATGSDVHHLPDGRIVPAAWYASTVAGPTTCAATGRT
ncbi:GNAT family N-acetyltransferase [Actinomadura oligospora]|uniref:GNAT family N-acetyltransferase n=1 Tax=Actinomadura oligospora TaxID=111804 RepID=UPI0004B1949F|nr:GNAT family N-acetyltransferase [Actinomadura oligospora]